MFLSSLWVMFNGRASVMFFLTYSLVFIFVVVRCVEFNGCCLFVCLFVYVIVLVLFF